MIKIIKLHLKDSDNSEFWQMVETEFDKNLKMARGHIGRNVVEITIKMKSENP